jgi:hypothetical protein
LHRLSNSARSSTIASRVVVSGCSRR